MPKLLHVSDFKMDCTITSLLFMAEHINGSVYAK